MTTLDTTNWQLPLTNTRILVNTAFTSWPGCSIMGLDQGHGNCTVQAGYSQVGYGKGRLR